jgi:hypothetical protein
MAYPCVLHKGKASTEEITRAQFENTIFSRPPEQVVVLLKGITEHKLSVRFRDDNWKDLSSLLEMEEGSCEADILEDRVRADNWEEPNFMLEIENAQKKERQRKVHYIWNLDEDSSEDSDSMPLLESSEEPPLSDGTTDKDFELEETETMPAAVMNWTEGYSDYCQLAESK